MPLISTSNDFFKNQERGHLKLRQKLSYLYLGSIDPEDASRLDLTRKLQNRMSGTIYAQKNKRGTVS